MISVSNNTVISYMKVQKYIKLVIEKEASDLHMSAGMLPMLRVHGEITPLYHEDILDNKQLTEELYELMSERHQKILEKESNVDFSYNFNEEYRFRVNVYRQRLGIAVAFRIIPNKIPSLENIRAPQVLNKLIEARKGLILVTGPTGSGKSTTLAAMISEINELQHKHIITIEDPIEFLHESYNCLINQREVGRDAAGFSSSLEAALREDPDVILVGEMRDIETIRLALTAAETGHLVFATLHTSSAAKTIDRIVDVFPGEEKAMVRTMLSDSLCAVIAQTLLPRTDRQGRVAAFEVMIATPAVRNLVRENKIAQIYSIMQTSSQQGMQTMESHIQGLYSTGVIDQKYVKFSDDLLDY